MKHSALKAVLAGLVCSCSAPALAQQGNPAAEDEATAENRAPFYPGVDTITERQTEVADALVIMAFSLGNSPPNDQGPNV